MADSLSIVLNLSLARALVVRDVDAALGTFHGLGFGDLALLRELSGAPDGRLRRVDLAQRLGITPSGVARQLAPLERIGLVGRESHERDARLALVVLTDTGRRIAAEAEPTADEAAERALGALWPAPEQERLGKLLARVKSP
jgi:DNA-binding MarR family transcriptional regulator